MANVYSLEGLVCFALLFICTSAYLRRVPRLKKLLFPKKGGDATSGLFDFVVAACLHACACAFPDGGAIRPRNRRYQPQPLPLHVVGVLHKGAVIGIKLHAFVAAACVAMGVYLLVT